MYKVDFKYNFKLKFAQLLKDSVVDGRQQYNMLKSNYYIKQIK
jgi:hypothetical protein